MKIVKVNKRPSKFLTDHNDTENVYIDKTFINLSTAFAVTLPKEAAKAAHTL